MICDEGHILRNESSSISKAMNAIKTRRRVVLTGTPLQNNLTECRSSPPSLNRYSAKLGFYAVEAKHFETRICHFCAVIFASSMEFMFSSGCVCLLAKAMAEVRALPVLFELFMVLSYP